MEIAVFEIRPPDMTGVSSPLTLSIEPRTDARLGLGTSQLSGPYVVALDRVLRPCCFMIHVTNPTVEIANGIGSYPFGIGQCFHVKKLASVQCRPQTIS